MGRMEGGFGCWGGGGGGGGDESEGTEKVELRTRKIFLAVGEACVAIF